MIQEKFKIQIIYLVSTISIIIAIFGFYDQFKNNELINFGKNFQTFFYLFIANLFLFSISRLVKVPAAIIGLFIASILIIATNNLGHILIALLITGSFYFYGLWFYSLIFNGTPINDSWYFFGLLGLTIFGIIIGLASFFPINYPGFYFFLTIIPCILNLNKIINLKINIDLFFDSKRFIDSSYIVLALYYLLIALMPEIGHDALAMHLFIPGYVYSSHEWGYDVEKYAWAVMPMLGDWIYSSAYLMGGEKATKLINFIAVILTSNLAGKIASWSCDNKRVEKITALLVLSLPIVFLENSSLFVDSIWAVLFLGAILAVLKIEKNNYPQYLLFFLICSAGSISAKATSISLIPILFIIIIIKVGKSIELSKIKFRLLIPIIILSGIIPYLVAWYITGNPIFPFFNGIFKSPFFPEYNFQPPFPPIILSPIEIYRMTFSSQHFIEGKVGSTGFQFIILLPVAIIYSVLFKKNKPLFVIGIGLLFTTITFLSTGYLRYVLPFFCIVTGGIIGALFSISRLKNKQLYYLFTSIFISTIILNLIYLKSASNYGNFRLSAIFDVDGRKDYLYHHQPIRLAIEFINSINLNRSSTAFFSSPLAGGLHGDALHPNWYNSKFATDIRNAKSELSYSDILIKNKVKYLILDENWGDPQIRKILLNIGDVIARFNSIIVLKVKNNYLYRNDLLLNNLGEFRWIGWVNLDEAGHKNNIISVSQKSAIYKLVDVEGSVQYLNRAKVTCDDSNAFWRLQVLWLDVDKKNIKTDLKVFKCSADISVEEMGLDSPLNAKYAMIFATGHEDKLVDFHEMKFIGP